MNNSEIVSKLWNLCNVLRDDGITYHQYVTELTYILFLKMTKETNTENQLPEKYRWDNLVNKQGLELKIFYNELLKYLGEEASSRIKEIYLGARTNIDEPKNLEKIIKSISELDWYSAKEEGLGNIYEGLLEKNANEKKSGAGQYFTPRVLIDIIVDLISPQPGEKCNDPACGTFGFMIAADRYIKKNTNNLSTLPSSLREFQKKEAFSGHELVHDTHKLALMNAMLHDIEGEIILGDTLSSSGMSMKGFDVVLSNPPFGTKKGGERATRKDLTFPTSNKQLNFLQHIYLSLKENGNARAAVVVPDNVLFTEGEGANIRFDLMEKCNLHTILRLPSGIFYAQGIKTNVLFFNQGLYKKDNTKRVWFYDMRTNMKNFGKSTPLKQEYFQNFIYAFNAKDRSSVNDERFSVFSREQILEKNNSLDLGLIRDDSVGLADLQDPIETGEIAIAQLEEAVDLILSVVKELKVLVGDKND